MRLEPATAAEAEARDVVSHPEWGGDLDIPTHLDRERRLRGSWWSRERMTSWVWRDGDDVLASCETYRIDCANRGRPGSAWGIASVFTETAKRGRGHASAMLVALAERLGGAPDGQALVLYSDVGAPIYERVGFVARPAWDRVLPAARSESRATLFAETELATVPLPAGSGDVSMPPGAAQLDWQLDRSRTSLRAGRRPDRCGARLGDDVIVWSDDGKRLLVLTLAASSTENAAALLAAAADTAARFALAEVRAWETPGLDWDTLARREPRTGGLPMLRPLVPGVDPAGWQFIPRGSWL